MIKKTALFLLTALSILLWGNYIGHILPHELPPVNSVITEKIAESKNNRKLSGYGELKNKKGLAKMFVTYNLAALENSYERTPNVKEDIMLFFDIVLALPDDTVITMFRFDGDNIEMDYEEEESDVEIFCNNLAKSGKFSKVNYDEASENSVKITVKRILNID